MRRYSQAKLILTVIVFSLIAVAVPANAAQHGSAISTSVASRHLGTVCKTVRSIHHRIGFICVGLASGHAGTAAFASFMPRSGKLDRASASRLVLYVDGGFSTGGVHRIERAGAGFILTTPVVSRLNNLWDGGPNRSLLIVRSGVFNACMQWRDGDRACTGASWLFGKRIRFSG